MNLNCFFDLFGHYSIAHNDNTPITEEDIKEILLGRNNIRLLGREHLLKLLEGNVARAMAQWDSMWLLAEDEIDRYDVGSKNGYGNQLKKQMQDHLAYDFASLERVVGQHVSEDDVTFIANNNPRLFLSLLKKLLNFLTYIARPVVDWNNTTQTMSSFEQVMDKIVEADRQ